MALELDNEIDQQNDPAEERDRMLFRLLTSSRSKSPLPTLSGAPDAPPPGAPPSSGAGSFLGRPVSPRIPAPRTKLNLQHSAHRRSFQALMGHRAY